MYYVQSIVKLNAEEETDPEKRVKHSGKVCFLRIPLV